MPMLDPLEREPYEYSGLQDLKFTLAGLAVIAMPFCLLALLLMLVF